MNLKKMDFRRIRMSSVCGDRIHRWNCLHFFLLFGRARLLFSSHQNETLRQVLNLEDPDFFLNLHLPAKYFNLAPSNRGILNIKLICIQWVISMSLCVPPMFAILGRMHLEPSGTMCTIDYWHGNFKNYNLYVVLLVTIGFSGPFITMYY